MRTEDTITIEAKVARFVRNAMWDDFQSGRSASYDSVELLVALPAELRGRVLRIYLSPDAKCCKILCQPGRQVRFTIERIYLAEDRTLFEGALSDLAEIES